MKSIIPDIEGGAKGVYRFLLKLGCVVESLFGSLFGGGVVEMFRAEIDHGL